MSGFGFSFGSSSYRPSNNANKTSSVQQASTDRSRDFYRRDHGSTSNRTIFTKDDSFSSSAGRPRRNSVHATPITSRIERPPIQTHVSFNSAVRGSQSSVSAGNNMVASSMSTMSPQESISMDPRRRNLLRQNQSAGFSSVSPLTSSTMAAPDGCAPQTKEASSNTSTSNSAAGLTSQPRPADPEQLPSGMADLLIYFINKASGCSHQERKCEDLREQLSRLERERENVKKNYKDFKIMIDQIVAKTSIVNKKLAAVTELRTGASEELRHIAATLLERLVESRSAAKESPMQLASRSTTIRELEQKGSVVLEDELKAQERSSVIDNQVSHLQSSLAVLNTRVEPLLKQNDNVKDSLSQTKAQLGTLKNNFEHILKQNEKLLEANADLNRNVVGLKEQNTSLNKSFDTQQKEIEGIRHLLMEQSLPKKLIKIEDSSPHQ